MKLQRTQLGASQRSRLTTLQHHFARPCELPLKPALSASFRMRLCKSSLVARIEGIKIKPVFVEQSISQTKEGTWRNLECDQKSWFIVTVAAILSRVCSAVTVQADNVSVGQDITDHEAKGSKGSRGKKRRRSDAREEDEEGQWAFLTGLSAVDQSWLHFALYSALQQQK